MGWTYKEMDAGETPDFLDKVRLFLNSLDGCSSVSAKVAVSNAHTSGNSAQCFIFYNGTAPNPVPPFPSGSSCEGVPFVGANRGDYQTIANSVVNLLNGNSYYDKATGQTYQLNSTQAFWAKVSMSDAHENDPCMGLWWLKDIK